MSSLIECLANQECADKLRIAQGRYTMEDVVRYDHKLDTWNVIASSGDHTVEAENLGHAYLRFTESHPDDFVQAIINTEAEVTTNLKADEYAHRADYPGTYDTGIKSSDPNVRGD